VRALFFHAVAGNPKVAAPLMGQAANTVRPFARYAKQAIHTAKSRQTRYQLSWEKVRNLHTVHLDPVDSLVRVPKKAPSLLLANWPQDKPCDVPQHGFVTNRRVPFEVEAATWTENGLRIKTSTRLEAGDEVFFGGLQTDVKMETTSLATLDVRDLDGRLVKQLLRPQEVEGYWLLTVEGHIADGLLVIDGEEVEAEDMTSTTELRRVEDKQRQSFAVQSRMLRVETWPADGLLHGDDGLRYQWIKGDSSGRAGNWIQLLPPESEAEEFMDPRAAFCEGDLEVVWTQTRSSKETNYKVKRIDQDRYQLQLDRFPPEGTTLYLPVDQRNLQLQRRAMTQLNEAPLPHHQGLLRLCEDPKRVRWPRVSPAPITTWYALEDATRDGTMEQRAFVKKALATEDFAFLEGPPGSGKTTAICEIVEQLVRQGKRVLLCASTHVAIDNVLERLLKSNSPIDAVRIGKIDKVDEHVQSTQLDRRVDRLLTEWEKRPEMQKYGDHEREEMAERTVIMAANLTCGTTMGIVGHPHFRNRDEDLRIFERPISTMPHWDMLIVDEASKTLIQEFLVPALMAKRWIIVGDVRQLPPFTERADIVANLRDLVDENERPVFSADHQRACLLLHRLLRPQIRESGVRWLIVEKPGVLHWIAAELQADPIEDLGVVRVAKNRREEPEIVDIVTIDELQSGQAKALKVAAADWVLVSDDVLPQVANWLPSNILFTGALEKAGLDKAHPLALRQGRFLDWAAALPGPYIDKRARPSNIQTHAECQTNEADWLARNDLANELAWRLTRIHELRLGQNKRERDRLLRDLDQLQPVAVDISEQIEEIEDIGLPSILEVLQEGIGAERAKRPSALTEGFRTTCPNEFGMRFESLTYQHRMHPDIASFSREVIYSGGALKDANTIAIRDQLVNWNFGHYPARRVWLDVPGREEGGVNKDEIRQMKEVLTDFFAWVRRTGPPQGRTSKIWEVACLCFYTKQERAISDMLRELTKDDRKTRFEVKGLPIEIVCGTVDRFQGREADLVLLSMRNTHRIGFLDSPNRLNVALTRARQQLVILGNYRYFVGCGVSELAELARRTQSMTTQSRWRTSR